MDLGWNNIIIATTQEPMRPGAELPEILATPALQGADQRDRSIKSFGRIPGPGRGGPAQREGPEGPSGLQF